MKSNKIVIVGAGPAGASLSHYLSNNKIPHTLIDKAKFPREKTCGDGYTIEVLRRIFDMNKEMFKEYTSDQDQFLPSYGFKLFTEKNRVFHYKQEVNETIYAPFYTGKRRNLDHLLVKYLNKEYCDIKLGIEVIDIQQKGDQNFISLKENGKIETISCNLIVAADGEKSIIKRKLVPEGNKKVKEHTYAGVKAYFKNVGGMTKYNELEFFFLKDLLPGYFWIFPLPNNEANVGIAVHTPSIMKNGMNLKKLLNEVIEKHPEISPRFKNAELVEDIKGMGIPLNSHRTKIYGSGYILLGDAATFPEPTTAKGIGVAMDTSKYAASVITEAYINNDFSKKQLKKYHDNVYKNYTSSWKMLYNIQKLLKYPFIIETFPSLFTLMGLKKRFKKNVKKWTDL